MTRKSFLALVSALAFVFMFTGCGNNKNKEEAEKPDIGNTEAVTDTDPADTGDSEAVTDTEPTDTSDTEVVPDEDNTDTGNITHDGCTTTESYGTNSLTRKETSEICYEKITERSCYKSMNPDSELIESILQSWQYKKIVFNKESCKELYGSETVECPDFIPEFFVFSKLEGCEIHTVDSNSACAAPCYDLYFSTNDEYFQKASFEEFGTKYIRSVSSDGLVGFSSTIEYNGSISAAFSWIEKGTDGTEIKKGVSIGMKIVDTRPDKCKDQEGKLYYEGDLIPEKCGILVCSENGWKIRYDNSPECKACKFEESETRYWRCYDGSLLERCNCVKDKETSEKLGDEWGKWSCIDGINLQCPPRVEECEDSEGRIYQHNEKIASECDYVYCTYNGWRPSGSYHCNFSCTDIGEKLNWLCADGVTEVDWCECAGNEEDGGIFTCIERADLNCPGGK